MSPRSNDLFKLHPIDDRLTKTLCCAINMLLAELATLP